MSGCFGRWHCLPLSAAIDRCLCSYSWLLNFPLDAILHSGCSLHVNKFMHGCGFKPKFDCLVWMPRWTLASMVKAAIAILMLPVLAGILVQSEKSQNPILDMSSGLGQRFVYDRHFIDSEDGTWMHIKYDIVTVSWLLPSFGCSAATTTTLQQEHMSICCLL